MSGSAEGSSNLQLAVVAQDVFEVGWDLENMGIEALRQRLGTLLSREEVNLIDVRKRLAELLRSAQEQTVPESDIAAGDLVQRRCYCPGAWPRIGLHPLGSHLPDSSECGQCPGCPNCTQPRYVQEVVASENRALAFQVTEVSVKAVPREVPQEEPVQEETLHENRQRTRTDSSGSAQMRAKSLEPCTETSNEPQVLAVATMPNAAQVDGVDCEDLSEPTSRGQEQFRNPDASALLQARLELMALRVELTAAKAEVHEEECMLAAHRSQMSEMRAESLAELAALKEDIQRERRTKKVTVTDGLADTNKNLGEISSLQEDLAASEADACKAWRMEEAMACEHQEELAVLKTKEDEILELRAELAAANTRAEEATEALRRSSVVVRPSVRAVSVQVTQTCEECETLSHKLRSESALCSTVQGGEVVDTELQQRLRCCEEKIAEQQKRIVRQRNECRGLQGKVESCEQHLEEQQWLTLREEDECRHAQERLESCEEGREHQKRLIVEQADYLVYQRMKLDDYQNEYDRLTGKINEKTELLDASVEQSKPSQGQKRSTGRYLQGALRARSVRINAWEPFAETTKRCQDLETFLTRKATSNDPVWNEISANDLAQEGVNEVVSTATTSQCTPTRARISGSSVVHHTSAKVSSRPVSASALPSAPGSKWTQGSCQGRRSRGSL